jgi:hypothetical protein
MSAGGDGRAKEPDYIGAKIWGSIGRCNV